MTLDGLQTIYKSVVSYQPAAVSLQETLPPDLPLRANQMLEFSTTADAAAILALANQVCPACTLTGGTQALTATGFAGTDIIAANGEPCYGEAAGDFIYFRQQTPSSVCDHQCGDRSDGDCWLTCGGLETRKHDVALGQRSERSPTGLELTRPNRFAFVAWAGTKFVPASAKYSYQMRRAFNRGA